MAMGRTPPQPTELQHLISCTDNTSYRAWFSQMILLKQDVPLGGGHFEPNSLDYSLENVNGDCPGELE